MTGATLANSPLLYGLIALGLAAIVAFALFCFFRARKRCLELGMSAETISNVVKATISGAQPGHPAGLFDPVRDIGGRVALVAPVRHRVPVL